MRIIIYIAILASLALITTFAEPLGIWSIFLGYLLGVIMVITQSSKSDIEFIKKVHEKLRKK